MNVIRQRYGKQVREEVLQPGDAVQPAGSHWRAEDARGRRDPSGADILPKADKDRFEFTAELEVFPEIPEIDVADLEIERPRPRLVRGGCRRHDRNPA
jgi:trigger factor